MGVSTNTSKTFISNFTTNIM